MKSSFDTIRLNELLKDFYKITGLRVMVHNDCFEEVLAYPSELPVFCSSLRKDKDADRSCRECDKAACIKVRNQKKPYIYKCHMGLTEAVTPIILGNITVGYIFLGHMFPTENHELGWPTIEEHSNKYNVDTELLYRSSKELKYVTNDYINSAANTMKTVAAYLSTSNIAMMKRECLNSQVDQYINEHLTEDLTVNTICENLNISRTKLYDISKCNYGMGIAEHIRGLRLDKAKDLLLADPAIPVREVASNVGIDDYNYFTKMFRTNEGVTPTEFRKNNLLYAM